MGLSNYKLYGGDKSTNTKNHTVSLYESLSDVQNQGYKVINNGQILYAKYGEVNDSKASKIYVKINGAQKALLTTARIIWGFNDVKLKYTAGSVSVFDSTCFFVGKYKQNYGDIDAELEWDVQIPPGASNVLVKYDWNAHGKPIVVFNWFNREITLNKESSISSGHNEFNIPNGSYWNNKCSVGSYDRGVANKNFNITNFSIEMDINVPIIDRAYYDNFSDTRNIPVDSYYKTTINNGYCCFNTNNLSEQPYLSYRMNSLHQGFDLYMTFTISELTQGCIVKVNVENQISEKPYDKDSNGTYTIKLSPNLNKITFTLMKGNGTPVSPFTAKLSNVHYHSSWTT